MRFRIVRKTSTSQLSELKDSPALQHYRAAERRAENAAADVRRRHAEVAFNDAKLTEILETLADGGPATADQLNRAIARTRARAQAAAHARARAEAAHARARAEAVQARARAEAAKFMAEHSLATIKPVGRIKREPEPVARSVDWLITGAAEALSPELRERFATDWQTDVLWIDGYWARLRWAIGLRLFGARRLRREDARLARENDVPRRA